MDDGDQPWVMALGVGLHNTKISREYPAGRAVDGVAAWLVW